MLKKTKMVEQLDEKVSERISARARHEAMKPRIEKQGDYIVEIRGVPGNEVLRSITFKYLDRQHASAKNKLNKLQAVKDEFFSDETWSD